MIAVCGLDCLNCDMREATSNPGLQQKIAAWFKKELNKDINPDDIHCMGCKGDRNVHWSADCWILRCCVDKKGLEFCYQCVEFPCDRLEEWAKGSTRYGQALKKLKQMKEKP